MDGNQKQVIGSVEYHVADEEYFEKRTLRRYAGVWSLWALGVGAVISGDFFKDSQGMESTQMLRSAMEGCMSRTTLEDSAFHRPSLVPFVGRFNPDGDGEIQGVLLNQSSPWERIHGWEPEAGDRQRGIPRG